MFEALNKQKATPGDEKAGGKSAKTFQKCVILFTPTLKIELFYFIFDFADVRTQDEIDLSQGQKKR